MPRILHLQASALLRQAHGLSGEALRTASKSDLQSNQSALELAVREARNGMLDRPVLIDAHSVIDNDSELVPIPFTAIAPLGIVYYLFLSADPETIADRRIRSARERPRRSVDALAAHQRMALQVCEGYSKQSGMPFMLLDAQDGSRNVAAALGVFECLEDRR
jgi:adenylate kinase